MEDVKIREALEREKNIDWRELIKSPPVYVEHLDGSRFLFKNAMYEQHDKVIWVFSGHNHAMVFYIDDLKRFGHIPSEKS